MNNVNRAGLGQKIGPGIFCLDQPLKVWKEEDDDDSEEQQ